MLMRSKAGLVISLSCVILALAIRPGAQGQQTPPAGAPAQGQPPGGGQRGPAPAPANIKVLPKEWTSMQVRTVMQTFVTSLGVAAPAGQGCLHCHAVAGAKPGDPPPPPPAAPPAAPPAGAAPGAPGAPGGGGQRGPMIDYANDANPKKDVARKMIQMVMAINDQTKALGDAAVMEKVTCFTCHQGNVKPTIAPPNGWGRGSFSLLPAGPPPAGGPGRGAH